MRPKDLKYLFLRLNSVITEKKCHFVTRRKKSGQHAELGSISKFTFNSGKDELYCSFQRDINNAYLYLNYNLPVESTLHNTLIPRQFQLLYLFFKSHLLSTYCVPDILLCTLLDHFHNTPRNYFIKPKFVQLTKNLLLFPIFRKGK